MKQNARETLLNILYKNSFKYDPDSGFTLVSGKKSDVYIDAKTTTLDSEAMIPLGEVFFEKIKDLEVDGIGGIPHGADPIAYATALISNHEGKPLSVFIIRKEPKKHGMMKLVEGPLKKGAKVVIVDDVVTTGGSTITAIERAREAGFEIKKVVLLVDRQEGGLDAIKREANCEVEAIFTREELLKIHKKKPISNTIDETLPKNPPQRFCST